MPMGSGDAQFWQKAANEARVAAETIGETDSAARVAMLAVAVEYEAIAKRAYSGERASSGKVGAARASAAPRRPSLFSRQRH